MQTAKLANAVSAAAACSAGSIIVCAGGNLLGTHLALHLPVRPTATQREVLAEAGWKEDTANTLWVLNLSGADRSSG